MEKSLLWCQEQLANKEEFDNVIWTDECSVQIDAHGHLGFPKVKQPRKLKPGPKHLAKFQIWGGISK